MFTKSQTVQGLLLLLTELSVLFGFYYWLIGKELPPPFGVIVSTLGSFFMLIVIGNCIAAKGKFSELRLMQRALTTISSANFMDGQKMAVFGQIFPNNGQPIQSPITQNTCLFYIYDMYTWETRGSGRNRSRYKNSDYCGFYLTPSSINTNQGKIRLLAFPILQGFELNTFTYSPETASIYNNAYQYIQNTKFEEYMSMGFIKLGKVYQMLKDIFTDDDGYIRKDGTYSTEPFDLKTRFLEEELVKEGEEVCLLGIWSAQKQGVVSDFSKSTMATLTKGQPEQTIQVAKKEMIKKLGVALLVFLAINLIIGTFWWIKNQGPKYGTVTFTETRNGQIVKQEVVGPKEETTLQPTSSAVADSSQSLIEYSSYANPIGKYSYQYPSNWKHSEIENNDLNSPDQKVYSVSSLVTNPQYAPMYGSLHVSYQLDGGQCIEKDQDMLNTMIALKTKVGDQTVEAYERQELNESTNRVIYERVMFMPKGDRCYKILILDQEGNPNADVFTDVLQSFQFYE